MTHFTPSISFYYMEAFSHGIHAVYRNSQMFVLSRATFGNVQCSVSVLP